MSERAPNDHSCWVQIRCRCSLGSVPVPRILFQPYSLKYINSEHINEVSLLIPTTGEAFCKKWQCLAVNIHRRYPMRLEHAMRLLQEEDKECALVAQNRCQERLSKALQMGASERKGGE